MTDAVTTCFELETGPLLLACAVTLFAGFVKGAVGFAMPLIMISAFSSFLPPDVALAGLILPTLITNVSQAFRQGPALALDSALEYRRFIIGTIIFIAISAQLFHSIPRMAYLLILGVPVTAFAALQLAGLPLALKLEHRSRAEWALGVMGGIYGGVSGIWGPPFLIYLLSVGVEKQKMIRAQGVVFLIGAIVLLAAHLGTGLMAGGRLAFSALLIVPAQLGMMAGYRLQDRLPQQQFRKLTQALLVLSGLNLVRQAFFG